jgi:hypothetical protein
MSTRSTREAGMAARTKIALGVFAAVAAFYLFAEHRAHLFGALPYLLLLACPLMHFFMHGRHGGHGGSDTDSHARHVGHEEDER